MGKIIRNGIEFSSTVDTANNISYDNSLSGLDATTAQKAIDEVVDSLEIWTSYSLAGVQNVTELAGGTGANNISLYQANEKGVKRVKLSLKTLVNIPTGQYTKVAYINQYTLPKTQVLKMIMLNGTYSAFLQIALDGTINIMPTAQIPSNVVIYIDETYI